MSVCLDYAEGVWPVCRATFKMELDQLLQAGTGDNLSYGEGSIDMIIAVFQKDKP